MRKTLLIVEAVELNREMLAEILKDEYEILMAADGEQAVSLIAQKHAELAAVLLALVLPKMDGLAVLEWIAGNEVYSRIPVLVVSGEKELSIERKCFDFGVADFVQKPYDNVLIKRRVKNVVDLYNHQWDLEEKVETQTETLRKQYKLLRVQADELKRNNENIIDIIGSIVEFRNHENGEHVKHVKAFTEILAKQLRKDYPEYGLDDKAIEMIVTASALHDVGKIAIPDSIVLKPGNLTEDERDFLRSHTIRGYEIIESMRGVWSIEYSKYAAEICRSHHERYDGRGYPDNLAGEEIPVSAQLVSLADCYDTLISERTYKEAVAAEEAFLMIIRGECGVFSPKLLECFRKCKEQLESVVEG